MQSHNQALRTISRGKKEEEISFHDSEVSKFGTKVIQICKFLKFSEIPAENSIISGNFWYGRLPRIPGNSRSEFPIRFPGIFEW